MWEFLLNPPIYLQQAIAVGVILLIAVGGSGVLVLRYGGLGKRVKDNEDNLIATQQANRAELEEAKRELKKDFDDQIENEKRDFTKQIQNIIQNAALHQQEIQTKLTKTIEANVQQEATNQKLNESLATANETIRNLNHRLDDVETEQKVLQVALDNKEKEALNMIADNKEKDALIVSYRDELRKLQTAIENQTIREQAMMDLMHTFGVEYKRLSETNTVIKLDNKETSL